MRLPYQALRDTMLGKRWTQKEMLQNGIIDETVDDAPPNQKALLERAYQIGEAEGPKVALGAWGSIKDGMFHQVIDASRGHRQVKMPNMIEKAFWDRLDRDKKAQAAAKAKL